MERLSFGQPTSISLHCEQQMLHIQKGAAAAVMVLSICALFIQWGQAQEAADGNDEEARKQRLDFMKSLRSEFEMFNDQNSDQPLKVVDEPILRFTNPIRNFFSDGGLFLWLDGKRPAAIATVSIRGNGSVWLETASLCPRPLRCLRKGSDYWMPQSASLAEQRLTDAPDPGASPSSRLTQMRRLCEQFAIRTEPRDEQAVRLRLMPQPVYRFEDEAAGITDGALFAFTETTDPEVILLLETVRPAGTEKAYWRFSTAKMTSRPVVAERNDKVIWSVPSYWLNPRSIKDAYQERQLTVYPPPIK
jgi:hypothetical protein